MGFGQLGMVNCGTNSAQKHNKSYRFIEWLSLQCSSDFQVRGKDTLNIAGSTSVLTYGSHSMDSFRPPHQLSGYRFVHGPSWEVFISSVYDGTIEGSILSQKITEWLRNYRKFLFSIRRLLMSDKNTRTVTLTYAFFHVPKTKDHMDANHYIHIRWSWTLFFGGSSYDGRCTISKGTVYHDTLLELEITRPNRKNGVSPYCASYNITATTVGDGNLWAILCIWR